MTVRKPLKEESQKIVVKKLEKRHQSTKPFTPSSLEKIKISNLESELKQVKEDRNKNKIEI